MKKMNNMAERTCRRGACGAMLLFSKVGWDPSEWVGMNSGRILSVPESKGAGRCCGAGYKENLGMGTRRGEHMCDHTEKKKQEGGQRI